MSAVETKPARSNARLFPAGAHPIDINTGLAKRDRILLQDTDAAAIFVGFGRRDVLQRQMANAERLAKGYNPDEDRDQNGRWTSGGGSTSINTTATLTGALAPAADVASGIAGTLNNLPKMATIFRVLAAGAAVEGLAGLAATFAVTTAFLGAYFIPFGRSAVASGTLPGHPDINYHYDGDTGHFTLYDANHDVLFAGTAGGDGLIRTVDGDVIGRRVDGTVILDSSIFPDEQSDNTTSASDEASSTRAAAQAKADTQTSLCPVPLLDRPGYKSPASIAYQQYVNILVNPDHPLSPGLAVYFLNPETGRSVAFDDCYQSVGDPAEAKGYGIARMVQNEKMARFLSMSFSKQADRQVGAAGGRPIDWYVAEPGAANFFRQVFATPRLSTIHVIDAPMPVMKMLISLGRRLLNL